jgi:hypothetical protein
MQKSGEKRVDCNYFLKLQKQKVLRRPCLPVLRNGLGPCCGRVQTGPKMGRQDSNRSTRTAHLFLFRTPEFSGLLLSNQVGDPCHEVNARLAATRSGARVAVPGVTNRAGVRISNLVRLFVRLVSR